MSISRRHFLLVAAGAFVQGGITRVEPSLLVRSARPEDLEMSLAGFSDYITPVENFFVRTHVPVPRVNVDDWRLSIDGAVATPLTLTLNDVKKLPAVEIVSVLECAGNGRSFYDPPVPGLQWANGAVGNARWRGVRLADVLERAGVKTSAREVLFNGADVPLGTMPDFQRSMPKAKALQADTLLAYEMNGEPLQIKHGFPLRVVAPGWSGHAWTKWLTSISVLDRDHDGFWMTRAYRHPEQPVQPGAIVPAEEMRPVTSLRVKSVIGSPLHNSSAVVGKPVRIRGVAWSGDAGPVTDVDVSVDNGRSWRTATLQSGQRTAFGWRQWEYVWTPSRQSYYTILARAHDAGGNVQPSYQEWNPSGYSWNVIPRIGVNVVSILPVMPEPSLAVSAEESQPPDALRSSCVVCHDRDVIRQQRLTRAQWDAEIRKMIGWGARVRDEDRDGLLDYLVRTYSPGRPPPRP
jgi:DMSO/TMAO reductase YedYZ molybdopterin-dependent catalytic subunit